MEEVKFAQIYKEDKTLCETAGALWVPFVTEVNGHEGKVKSDGEILEGLEKRIAIQGSREDMHFEIMFLKDTPVGIAMFAIDLGTVYGLLEKGYGTVMGFYVRPEYRKQGLGKAFWLHIEETLRRDGTGKFYVCPDSVTGVPFWTRMGFADSGLMDPDDMKPIYTKSLK